MEPADGIDHHAIHTEEGGSRESFKSCRPLTELTMSGARIAARTAAQCVTGDPPTITNGFRFDGMAADERDRQMARKLLAGGRVVVAILGGGHDLKAELQELSPHAVYERIEPEAWQRAMKR